VLSRPWEALGKHPNPQRYLAALPDYPEAPEYRHAILIDWRAQREALDLAHRLSHLRARYG